MKAFIKSFIIIHLALVCFINGGHSLSTDSTKKVDIKVIVKERSVNYDSIFNYRRTDVATPKASLRKNPSAPAAQKGKKQIYSPKNTYPAQPVSQKNSTNIPYKNTEASKNSSDLTEPDGSNITPDVEAANKPTDGIVMSNPGNAPIPDSLHAVTDASAPGADVSKSSIPKNESVSKKVKDTFYNASIQMGGDKLIFLWVGCALMLIGVIAGLVFNKSAFIVSGVGAIFLLIGLYI